VFNRKIKAARLAWLVTTGEWPKGEVDHINGDPSDNRRENLRICTHAENMMNRKMHKSNAIGIKGVYQNRNKFRAQIRVNGKVYRLGSFCTPQDAGAAYLAAASKLHGEFVRQS
jgi:hypothetical protein